MSYRSDSKDYSILVLVSFIPTLFNLQAVRKKTDNFPTLYPMTCILLTRITARSCIWLLLVLANNSVSNLAPIFSLLLTYFAPTLTKAKMQKVFHLGKFIHTVHK